MAEATFTTIPAVFENNEKFGGSEIKASIHKMREQFENGKKLGDNKLAAVSPAKEICLHLEN